MKTFAAVVVMIAGLSQVALAVDAKVGYMPEMTTEQRQKMADVHEKMAVCLRSERPLADCHEEMRSACKASMGSDVCPMVDGPMGGMRHHGGKMKMGASTPAQ